jgi:hypothetical protein
MNIQGIDKMLHAAMRLAKNTPAATRVAAASARLAIGRADDAFEREADVMTTVASR